MRESVNLYREFYFLLFTHSCEEGSENLAVPIITVATIMMMAASFSVAFKCLDQTIRCQAYKNFHVTAA
jgi:hypothetical protein